MADTDTNRPDDAGPRTKTRRSACPALSLIVAILIAAVLQFAAAAKVAHGSDVLRRMKGAAVRAEHGLPTDFTPADYNWLVEPDAGFHGGVPIEFPISAGEFLLVVLVLVGHRRRAVWLLVPLVFATFFGYALRRTLNDQACGCFGDLWRPPDGVSIAMDASFVILALGIAALRRTRPGVLVATAVLTLCGVGGGYWYAGHSVAIDGHTAAVEPQATPSANPEPKGAPAGSAGQVATPAPTTSAAPDATAPEKLVASTLMAKYVEAQKTNGEPQAYYVFIWDPTCSTCERLKPVVEDYQRQYQEEGNPFLQILLFKKQDLRDQLAIQPFEWDDSPSIFVVRNGEITDLPGGEESMLPDEVLGKLTKDEPLGGE